MAYSLADITAKVMPKSGGDIASLTIGGKTVITSDGGILNGAIVTTNGEAIRGSHDYGNVTIRGGTAYQKGSQISFYGKDHESYAGLIHMIAYDDTHGMKHGYMYPDGKFTWDGKNIVRSVNGSTADVSGNVTISVTPTTTPNVIFAWNAGVLTKPSFKCSGGSINSSSGVWKLPSGGTWRYVVTNSMGGTGGTISGGKTVTVTLIGIAVRIS